MNPREPIPCPQFQPGWWLAAAVAAGALFLIYCGTGDSAVLASAGRWVAEWHEVLRWCLVAAMGMVLWLLLPRLGRLLTAGLVALGLGLMAVSAGFVMVGKSNPPMAVMLLVGLSLLGGMLIARNRGRRSGWGALFAWVGTLRPVFARELLVQSRLTFTYGGRVAGAAGLLAVSWFYLSENEMVHGQGLGLLEVLHTGVLVAAMVVAPLLTADCVSRERREGTLDLLFLTPLRPGQIALAKWLAHAAKAVGFYLALTPVLALPILMGGVSWDDVVLSVTTTLLVIGWMLAVGVMTSSWGRSSVEAVLVACLVGAVSLAALMLAAGYGMALLEFGFASGVGRGFRALDIEAMVVNASWFLRGPVQDCCGRSAILFEPGFFWSGLASAVVLPVAGTAFWLWLAGLCMKQSLTFTLPFTRVAFQLVWGERRCAPKDDVWKKEFRVPPLGLALGRRWLRRLLERDPIGWLERRDSAACGLSWISLAGVVICCGTARLADNELDILLSAAAWTLIALMCLVSAAGFRRERQTGMLELLLVTPMQDGEVLHGFLRGLWAQARPAALVLWGLWVYRMIFLRTHPEDWNIVFLLATLLAMPVIGFFFSMWLRHYLLALGATVAVGILLPLAAGYVPWMLLSSSGPDEVDDYALLQVMMLSVLLFMTVLCYRGLRRLLARRQFANAES